MKEIRMIMEDLNLPILSMKEAERKRNYRGWDYFSGKCTD